MTLAISYSIDSDPANYRVQNSFGTQCAWGFGFQENQTADILYLRYSMNSNLSSNMFAMTRHSLKVFLTDTISKFDMDQAKEPSLAGLLSHLKIKLQKNPVLSLGPQLLPCILCYTSKSNFLHILPKLPDKKPRGLYSSTACRIVYKP